MKNKEIIKNIYLPNKTQRKVVPFINKNFSLYIGDLSSSVQEKDLLNIFSKMNGLALVRICRDIFSKKSLGYGYINFKETKYAKKAIKKMNFYFDKNLFKKPLRIMWKESNKTLRKSGKGNIFVNYLPSDFKTIDLYKLFLPFGKILSCKICFDENGNSKKFGFVHFFSFLDSKNAIQQLSGKNINGKVLHISPFIKKETRDILLPRNLKFTNVYIKELSINMLTETNIKNIFEVFGEITSIMIPKKLNKPKGFAFVNFASHLDAEEAVSKMNNKKVGESILYVSRAQTKQERQKILYNIWNIKKKLSKDAQKRFFIVIKGIKGDDSLHVIIFLFLFLGDIGKFKILKMENDDYSFFLNLVFGEKTKFISIRRRKFALIFSKFFIKLFNFFNIEKFQNSINQGKKNISFEKKHKELEIKFLKNERCFKFKETEVRTWVLKKLNFFIDKKGLKNQWRKIIFYWLRYLRKNISINLIKFVACFLRKSFEDLAFFRKPKSLELQFSIKIW